MAGFGSIAPGADWQDEEARANLAALQAARPAPARPSLLDSIFSLGPSGFIPRTVNALAATPTEQTDEATQQYFPETFVNPAVKGLVGAVGEAVKSGVTAPGDAASGKLPLYDENGHISQEAIRRAFDTASLAGGGAGVGALSSDAARGGAALAVAEHAPAFYSPTSEALARVQGKNLTGDMMLNQLKRYGAKPEEMDWAGVTQLLKDRGNQPVTRDEVSAALEKGNPQIKTIERTVPAWEDLPGPVQQRIADKFSEDRRLQRDYRDPEEFYMEKIRPNAADYQHSLNEPGAPFTPPLYSEYQLPGGENYRERLLTLPEAKRDVRGVTVNDPAGNYVGPHWEEPNVLLHRRSTDRIFPADVTPEQQAALDAHSSAQGQMASLRQQQADIGRKINETAEPLNAARTAQIRDDVRARRITASEGLRQLEAPYEHPELKPLQDQLQELRDQETALRKSLPPKPDLQGVRSLHAEEIQSDWHQAGRKMGYEGDNKFSPELDAALREWGNKKAAEYGNAPPRDAEDAIRQYGVGEAQQIADRFGGLVKSGSGAVPDAPFKDTWHQLAAHDMLREAAEGGYPRISWTAGEAAPTNPKNLRGPNIPAAQRAEVEKSGAGLEKFYNEKMVNTFNKLGKQHGVQVEKGSIPGGARVVDAEGKPGSSFATRAEAERLFGNHPDWKIEDVNHPVYYMDVPQSLRDQALKKGFSLFEDSAAARPIAALEHAQPAQAPITPKPEPANPDWVAALKGATFEPSAPAISKTKLVDEQGLPVQGAAYTKEARSVLDDIAKGPKGAGPMDLSTQGQVPDVPQTSLERYVPPRGVSPRMVDALANPDVTKGVAASIKKGMPVADWYHTEPVRRAFVNELGPIKGGAEFQRYMDTVAATSPRSDVPTNVRNASYYYGIGSPENLPPKNPYPFGHVAQNLHRQNFETISRDAGWDVMQNPKPASFAANLKGNLQPVTVDTHAFRNIAMRTNDPRFLETSISQKYKPGVNRSEDSMVKKYGEVRGDTVTFRPQQLYKEGRLTLEEAKNIPSFWATKPKDNEYAAAENLFRDLASKAKIAPADAQAAAWAGAGDLTGLGTVGTHTFPELMNERILFTSRMRGESPQKTLSDFIRGKRPLLSDTAVGAPIAAFGSIAPGQR